MATTVLFVDDMPDMGALIVDILQCEGIDVEWCGAGAEAAARLTEERYAALVTDLVLGGPIDGEALARQAVEQGVPALIVSGDIEALERLGAAGFEVAQKPVEMDHLLRWLRRQLPGDRAVANG